MALLFLAATTHPSRADCPAAPIADPDDMAISFLAANGVQAASASLLASSVKEGTLVYDDSADKLKVCDGNNWIDVGSGSGTDTLASLSCTTGQIAKFDGSDWACAADGGGGGSGNGVAFSVNKNGTNQTVTSGAEAVITWSTEVFDTNNNFASNRFTPTVAGKYLITLSAYAPNGVSFARIYKNSTKVAEGYNPGSNAVVPATVIVDLNGTTDYIEGRFYTTGSTTLEGLTDHTYMSGFLIGGGSGSDTLASLSCSAGQVPEWDGSDWVCGTGSGSGGFGAYQTITQFGTDIVAPSAGMVLHSAVQTGSFCHVQIFVNGVNVATDKGYNTSSIAQSVTAPVAAGDTYRLSNDTDCTNVKAFFVPLTGGGGSATAAGSVAGAVQFNDGSDAFAADDVNLVWDNTNKRLGIGTATAISPPGGTPGGGLMLHGDPTAPFFQISSPQTTSLYVGQISFANSAIGASEKRVSMFASRRVGADDAGSLEFFTRNSGSLVRRLYIAPDGGAAFGSGEPDASSLLDLTSTTKGFLPPRMTTMDRDAITSPAEGLVVYNTTTKSLDVRVASSWLSFGGNMTGNTIVSGWPDAIRCTTSSYGTEILYLGGTPYSSGNYLYLSPLYPDTDIYFYFTPAGGYSSKGTQVGTSDCENQSIAQLYAAGKAFNFVGGSTASADGTAGQVQFNEGGSLKADADLHWDNINKRLGIGTSTPSESLEMAGAIYSNPDAFNAGNLYAADSGGNKRLLVGVSSSPANSTIVQSAGGGINLRDSAYNSRLLVTETGNVGIGSISPNAPLEVRGQTAAPSQGLLVTTNSLTYGSAGSYVRIGHGASSGDTYGEIDSLKAGGSAYGDLVLQRGGGKVGIGTSTPASKLHVAAGISNVYIGETLEGFGTGNNNSGAIYFGAPPTAVTDTTAGIEASWGGTTLPQIHIGTLRQFAPTSMSAYYTGLLTFTGRGAERMRIETNGNVGIGTASPSTKLQVSDPGNAGLLVESTGTGNGAAIVFGQNYGSGQRTPAFIGVKSTGDYTEDKLRFVVANNISPTAAVFDSFTRMTIDGTSGNVGIGTASPAQKLDVNGTIKANAITLNGAATTAILHATAGTGTTTIQGTNTGSSYGIFCNAANCGGTTAWINTSDLRLKERIETLDTEDGLETVLRLRPVAFHWKDQRRDAIEGRKLGLIAQEVEPVVPEIVHTADDAQKTKSIAYSDLVPVLVRAIQDLKADNDNLRAELKAAGDELKAANDNYKDLRREVEALKAAR